MSRPWQWRLAARVGRSPGASGKGKGMEPTASVMAAHQVEIAGEPRWQRRLRLLQALWREEQELPAGVHQGTGDSPPLGSRLAMPEAQQSLHNYLSETIRGVVRAEVEGEQATTLGKVYATPRIYDDLLSSQPLCFNLFAELKAEPGHRLATQVLRHLWPERVDQVSRIEFEHSPGRSDPTYTGTRSAFDVYVEHTTPAGGEGFIGIEVKYHENLQVEPARNHQRLDEVAEQSGVFFDEHLDELRKPPLQQVCSTTCSPCPCCRPANGRAGYSSCCIRSPTPPATASGTGTRGRSSVPTPSNA